MIDSRVVHRERQNIAIDTSIGVGPSAIVVCPAVTVGPIVLTGFDDSTTGAVVVDSEWVVGAMPGSAAAVDC